MKKILFNATLHITKPVVKLSPSKLYFTLSGVTYERVEAPAKKAVALTPSLSSGGSEAPNPLG